MPEKLQNSSLHDGKINLEQQRKRAKELLRQLRDGTAPGLEQRLTDAGFSSHPRRLSDAQWLIAQERGFSSWPKLKAHIDAIAFAACHPGFDSDDEANSVHWRCGNDIAHTLRVAGFKGGFRMLTDPLCMGPVPDLPPPEFQAVRSNFISRAFAMDDAESRQRLAGEYADIDLLAHSPHVVLWCEADAYDQLFLIRLLAGLQRLPPRLELIEINQVPGVERFIGIGQLAPDLLAWLWPQRRPLGEDALRLARRAWTAYRSSSPLAWAALAHAPSPPLPFLAPALLRQLRELPALRTGLSLTEHLSLEIIGERGTVAFGSVFAELIAKREPLPYLGDIMFHALLRPLIDAPSPLIIEAGTERLWPERTLTLTPLGQQVTAGCAYWFDRAGMERWVGGVRIRSGRPHWAIDHDLRPVWRP